jgi:hypothetical protein
LCADVFSEQTVPYLPRHCFVGPDSIVASLRDRMTTVEGKRVPRLDVAFPASIELAGASRPFGLGCGEAQTWQGSLAVPELRNLVTASVTSVTRRSKNKLVVALSGPYPGPWFGPVACR